MRMSQFYKKTKQNKNELQAQYNFTYQTQYIAKKYVHTCLDLEWIQLYIRLCVWILNEWMQE